MNKQLAPSDTFVKNVMRSLPQRESTLQRIGNALLSFVLSPFWMWSCLTIVVLAFHRPILLTLSTAFESPTLNLLLLVGCGVVTIAFFTRQMIRDMSL